MTYDELNDVVHECSDAIEKAGVEMSTFDRCQLNDYLSNYLQDRGVEFKEEKGK